MHQIHFFDAPYRPFAIFVSIGYPGFYLLWSWFWPHLNTGFEASLITFAVVLVLPLLFYSHWPAVCQKYLKHYWYLTLGYTLPFFFTYQFLMTPWSLASLVHSLLFLFILLILADKKSMLLILPLGVAMAYLMVVLQQQNLLFYNIKDMGLVFIDVGMVLVVSMLYLLGKQYRWRTEKKSLHDLSMMVAHELRTPLLTIKDYANGLKRYLPAIFDGYLRALNEHQDLPVIRPDKFKAIVTVLKNIEAETYYSNTIIDMLLLNTQNLTASPHEFEYHEIRTCVQQALKRYPYRQDTEKNNVRLIKSNGFAFLGSKILLQNILFNLIKNSLHAIERAGKGSIEILILEAEEYNELHVKDTGTGIDPNEQKKIFQRFYTTKVDGSGIGLYVSKLVMKSFGGDIKCHSTYGEYTEFTLLFPKIGHH